MTRRSMLVAAPAMLSGKIYVVGVMQSTGMTMAGSVWALTDEQCRTGQAKITYLGEQTKPVPTILFGVTRELSVAAFLRVQRSPHPYNNDTMPYTKTFAVGVEEFRRMLATVRPVISGIGEQRADFLSFSVICGAHTEVIGGEFLISRTHGQAFYTGLLNAISRDNATARAILTSQYRNVYPT